MPHHAEDHAPPLRCPRNLRSASTGHWMACYRRGEGQPQQVVSEMNSVAHRTQGGAAHRCGAPSMPTMLVPAGVVAAPAPGQVTCQREPLRGPLPSRSCAAVAATWPRARCHERQHASCAAVTGSWQLGRSTARRLFVKSGSFQHWHRHRRGIAIGAEWARACVPLSLTTAWTCALPLASGRHLLAP